MIAKNSGIKYLRLAFKVEGLRGPVRAVFLEISSYTNADGIAYPGMKRIAVRSGYSRKTVERATEELEARGLLRRIRRKSDRGLQGYIFAIVLPIGLLVESDGHKVSKRADTKSGHNYTLELLKELEGTGQADFQEAIFGILKDRIDLNGNRDLFSLAPITEALCRDSDMAVQRMQQLLESARIFQHVIARQGRKLESWNELIEFHDRRLRTSPEAVMPDESSVFCPLLKELVDNMSSVDLPRARALTLLSGVSIKETSDKIEVCSKQPTAVNMLRERHKAAVRRMGVAHGKPVDIIQNGIVIERVRLT